MSIVPFSALSTSDLASLSNNIGMPKRHRQHRLEPDRAATGSVEAVAAQVAAIPVPSQVAHARKGDDQV